MPLPDKCGDCLIGTGNDADDTSMGPIVGVSDERLEEIQVFAEHFGPIVDGEDVDDGGQSLILTDEGLERSQALFRELFTRPPQ